MGSIVNISETPAQLRPHRQDRWANREPQAAPSTRRRFGTCPLAAAGPPTQLSAGGLPLACPPQLREAPAGSGSWRKALGQQSNARSPTPARPHALTVGPAPGTVSAGATTTDLDRHRPCPAQPPPHCQSPTSGWQPPSTLHLQDQLSWRDPPPLSQPPEQSPH